MSRYRTPCLRGPRRTAIAATIGLTLLVPTVGSSAAPIAQSTTTLTASPASSTAGTSVTLTATVRAFDAPGLGVTPTGTVGFVATNGTSTADVGTAQVSPCLLTECTATLTTTTLPIGTTSVTAYYSGDSLVAPSSGSAPVAVTGGANSGSSSTVYCYRGQTCDTGMVRADDGTTTLDVVADASANNQSVSASLTAGTLHCQPAGGKPDNDGDDDDGVFVGALATFTNTATDAGKTISYTGVGATGATMLHQYKEHPYYAGCFGSPNPFKGYTHGVYGDAPFSAADGMYVAQLSNCSKNGGRLPCVTNISGTNSDTYRVRTAGGDPKIIG